VAKFFDQKLVAGCKSKTAKGTYLFKHKKACPGKRSRQFIGFLK
jgi:hypothetical protein